jgi:thymidylate synthase ThyX
VLLPLNRVRAPVQVQEVARQALEQVRPVVPRVPEQALRVRAQVRLAQVPVPRVQVLQEQVLQEQPVLPASALLPVGRLLLARASRLGWPVSA